MSDEHGIVSKVIGRVLRNHKSLARVARVEARDSLATLKQLRDDPSVSAAVRRRCAYDLLCWGFGEPVKQVQAQIMAETRSYVLRAPPVLSSAEEWELKYGGPEAIEVKPNLHERSDCAVGAAQSDEPA